MNDKFKLLISDLGESRVKCNVDLTEFLQTKLGGIASFFYIATCETELIKVIQLCQELKIDFLIIGTGSKIAISKSGFLGMVIKNRNDSLRIFGIKGKVSRSGLGVEEALIEAGSGVSLKGLNEYIHAQMLGGLEGFKKSLNTLGGSFYITPELRQKSQQVKVLNPQCQIQTKQEDELSRKDIILSVVFKLKSKK
ncbi:MAG: FAD-binding protein [Candidatus Daviesbacteria bacterium]|nr:FAD-binding protein [Candidatus Daviesbacteria bacterium]